MDAIGLIASVLISASLGSAAGFVMGLIPGLHVNNLAAVVLACSSSFIALFSALFDPFGTSNDGMLLSVFLCAALISHCFSEAVPNTYVGIPGDDAITVLPAHRLARSGLGWTAVKASADGSLAGAILGAIVFVPIVVLMGAPFGLYDSLRRVMGYLIALLSVCLLLSDTMAARVSLDDRISRLIRMGKIASLFMASGLLGMIVLESDYFACDLPGCSSEFVQRSSLLLPLFAGLFGLPTLLLSLRERDAPHRMELAFGRKLSPHVGRRAEALALLGGFLVGWIPGMTSGSSATLCSLVSRKPAEDAANVDDAVRFIWLYSAVSTAGAILSVGALFSIMRARSGVMDAVVSLTSPEMFSSSVDSLLLPSSMLLSMMLAALISHAMLMRLRLRLRAGTKRLCSKRLSVCAAFFVCGLVAFLTGLRGMLLLSASCSLGLLPPMIGVRRIHLMGCLLIPIALSFLLD